MLDGSYHNEVIKVTRLVGLQDNVRTTRNKKETRIINPN